MRQFMARMRQRAKDLSRLRRAYWIVGAALLVLVFVPVCRSVELEFMAYRNAGAAMQMLGLLRATLQAFEAVSAERGPANALLQDDERKSVVRIQALRAARRVSDQLLARLAAEAAALPCKRCPLIARATADVRTQLERGRQAMDGIIADERATREPGAIDAAVAEMIAAATRFTPALSSATAELVEHAPAVTDPVVLARNAGELREYAGREGSLITELLVTGRPMSRGDVKRLAMTQGRVIQLLDAIEARLVGLRASPALAQALDDLHRNYLADASMLVSALILEIERKGRSHLGAAEFADRYTPGLKSIIQVRDQCLVEVESRLRAARNQRLLRVLLVLAAGVLIMAATGYGVFYLARRYASPLDGFVDALSAGRQRQDALLSELSHDIRSPQAGIIALLEMARSTDAYQAEPELFYRIERYARRTLGMVDDFVRLIQLQSVERKAEVADLRGIVMDACDSVAAAAMAKGIRVDVDMPEAPMMVRTSRELLTRALVNLLDNAIKFSPDGKTVHCRVHARGRRIVSVIRDQGYGIDKNDLPFLFQRFRRFSVPGQPSAEGTGLGLAFVKSVIAQMRGRIVCESNVGMGTTFTLEFPGVR
ncbi:sensor histidine kinase [Cupriavidus sp. CP313]